MQEESTEEFVYIMDCALNFNMRKLLACCEYHIAADPNQRFRAGISQMKYPIPISSVLRIATGLRVTFLKAKGLASITPYMPSPKEFVEM